MPYSTTITSKGQITIPKEIRDFLALKQGGRLEIKFERTKREIQIKASPDILDLAGSLRPKKVVDAVKIRELMGKTYRAR